MGYKLKVLMRQCGVMLSEEAFTLKFASELGGTGSMCDYETFMRFVCEHDASDDARSHRAARSGARTEVAAGRRQHAARRAAAAQAVSAAAAALSAAVLLALAA